MAPRKRPDADTPAKEPETEAVKPGEVLSMVPKGPLMSLLALDKRTKKQQSEIAGELGSKVGDICERYGTNRKALGVIRTLNRMEPEKLADFLDHFDYLLDVSGLEKRAEQVQRLPLAEGEPDETEKETAAADSKITRPQFGARAAASAE